MSKLIFPTLLFYSLLFWASCSTDINSQNKGAIVLGDSSLIVTELDSHYLSNNVEDIIPHKIVSDTIQQTLPSIDGAKLIAVEPKKEEELSNPITANALSAPFKHLEVFIENIQGREGKSINWEKDRAAAFSIVEGDLEGKALSIKGGGSATKVRQRTQTVVMLKSTDGKYYQLTALPTSSGNWETLKGSKGIYNIVGLDKKHLKYNNKLSSKALRNAVQKLARSNRMSRREEQKLLNSVKNVHHANQAPCSIALQTVIWKITGKDPSGKTLERELRIDINL
jgi:hypothetical protein